MVESAVECCCLAASGRTGHQQDLMRMGKVLYKELLLVFFKSKVL